MTGRQPGVEEDRQQEGKTGRQPGRGQEDYQELVQVDNQEGVRKTVKSWYMQTIRRGGKTDNKRGGGGRQTIRRGG